MSTGYFPYSPLLYMNYKITILLTLLSLLVLFGFEARQPAAVVKINRSYFVDSKTGNDANSGTSISAPWKTLARLSGLLLKPGDSLKFASGSTFAGGCTIESSGSDEHPIVITSYGLGGQPVFSNPDYSLLNGNVFQVKGSYITIDGLHFETCTQGVTEIYR